MTCHAIGCQNRVVPGLPMCNRHLSMFSKSTQERLTAR